MKLHQAKEGMQLKILDIDVDQQSSRILLSLGILKGENIRVLFNEDPFPIIIEIHGSLIAIDREIAKGIEVKELEV